MALGVERFPTDSALPRADTLGRRIAQGWIAPAVLLAFWPVWVWYLRGIVDRAEDPWSLLALGAAALFYFSAIQRRAAEASPRRLGLVLGILSIYILSYAFVPHIVRLGFALAAPLAFVVGARLPNLGGLGLLVLSLPLFPSLQFYGGFPLRMLSARLALPWLHTLGFGVELRGMDLVTNGMVVSVDAPCSGIQMLWSALFLASVLVARAGLSFGRGVLVYALALMVVVLGNALRMATLFCLEMLPALKSEAHHAGVGLIVFAAGCAAIVACATLAERAQRRVQPCAD